MGGSGEDEVKLPGFGAPSNLLQGGMDGVQGQPLQGMESHTRGVLRLW